MKFRIETSWVKDSYAFEYYRNLFRKNDVKIVDDNAPKNRSRINHIFYIQSQGFMPTTKYLPTALHLPLEERGWVKSGVDTGGQTFYSLDEAYTLAKMGKAVTIIAQRFSSAPTYLRWYTDETSGGYVDIVRIPAGGIIKGEERYGFVRKEDLYHMLPWMARDTVAVAMLRGADAFIGGYADGGVIATVASGSLGVPSIFIAHSLGPAKLRRVGLDPDNPGSYFVDCYNFADRIWAERRAFLSADFIISNTPEEAKAFDELYGIHVQRHKMQPAGVNRIFFDAAENIRNIPAEARSAADALRRSYGLEVDQFFMSWGRIAEGKNIPAQAEMLATLRRMFPAEYDNVKMVIVGGNPACPRGEERLEAEKLRSLMERYDLKDGKDVIRIGNLPHDVIAALAKDAIAYLGTQLLEPFGMAAAEMLALNGNGFVVVPQVAGISQWLDQINAKDAVVTIDLASEPGSRAISTEKFESAARTIHQFRIDKPRRNKAINNGAQIANRYLRWEQIAGGKLDILESTLNERGIFTKGALYLSMPTWYRPSDSVTLDQDGKITDERVPVVRRLADQVRTWLHHQNGAKRRLIAVWGKQARSHSNLLWAALDRPNWRAKRVAGEALVEIKNGHFPAIRQEDIVDVGSFTMDLRGIRAVVADVPPDIFIGMNGASDALQNSADISICIDQNPVGFTPHLIVSAGQVLVNQIPSFAK